MPRTMKRLAFGVGPLGTVLLLAVGTAAAPAGSVDLEGSAQPGVARIEPVPTRTLPSLVCLPGDGPDYYAFELHTTRNVPGTGLAEGRAEVSVSGSSPFTVSLAEDGSYLYDVRVSIDRMKAPRDGRLVAWVTTPDIDRIQRIGALDEHLRGAGQVAWNKFIVVVTLEPGDEPEADIWTGPVVFRGMSRSGMMHTMVGHGALQQENCAAYGYGN
jgi:hypothetical protein